MQTGAMQPRLVAITGATIGAVHPLDADQLSIGRDSLNQLRLAEPSVSRKHCRIELCESDYRLVDLESRNGTFLNGVPVTSRALQHGDKIRLGQSEFVFLLHEGDPDRKTHHHPTNLTLQFTDLPRDTVSGAARFDGKSAARNGVGDHVGRMARDLSALLQIGSLISTIRDAERLQRELLRLIFEVIPAESGAVLLLANQDEEEDSICVWHRKGGEEFVTVESGLAQQAIWERNPVLSEAPNRHILCAPLIAVERILGVLYLTSGSLKPPFAPDHVSFLESVSRIAAVALENILAMDAIRSENGRLKQQLNPPRILVGESREMTQLEQVITRVAKTDSTVLIRGESGTGKEVVARTIHTHSPRRERPFVAINCAAIPETLLESELFGSEKGAFTGATAQRKGKFEAAADGTVLLDEIGELAPGMQAKLLRVLQQREFERIGGTVTIPLKARVLAATNKNLEEAIKSGEFRQDLYYRLNVVSVTVPPLRERSKDIPLLALYFAAKYAETAKRPFKGISPEARKLLLAYDWPGNVRELENAIEHAIVLGLTDEILPEDLPGNIVEQQAATIGARYYEVLNEKKKEIIRSALSQTSGNYPEAARILGLHPKYLHRLAANLNLKNEA